MVLKIDGKEIIPNPGQSLLDLVRELDLDSAQFADRPLAAGIAGDVFQLNYVPVRAGEMLHHTVRRAMEASGGQIRLLRYADPAGKDVYERTALFTVFLALHELYPNGSARLGCTVGLGVYVEVQDSGFSVEDLKEKIRQLVEQDIPLVRKRMPIDEAVRFLEEQGQPDKARLLKYSERDWEDVYFSHGYAGFYYGELAPSTGYLKVWDVIPAEGGFFFVYPDPNVPDRPAAFQNMPKFLSVSNEGKQWCRLLECETVADLNALTENGGIRELIRVNEALHEKRFSQIADMICDRGAKAVMLAGPSSSGKTTSANRLAVQLRVHGRKPILMSLDDYYADRDTIPPGPDGKLDLEHINTIDCELFSRQLQQLLQGQEVTLPSFNFLTGKREWTEKRLRLQDDSVIIVEGLHALNPVLLPRELDAGLVFRLYVSPLLPMSLDFHNRIPTSYLRLLRRIMRDYETRGASVQHTLAMWDSVRRGEKRWIFPYQENADVIFNSSTLYELAVLKRHIYPLLTRIGPEDGCYDAVRGILRILDFIRPADVDDEIPPTSLVREFIGGNRFYS
ncbi:MAG: nucleoside kinase [Firmicutes bacterium]|nr:nucleoside kinase [Bacillota bacterium]